METDGATTRSGVAAVETTDDTAGVRPVERTYSDDERYLISPTDATLDGEHDFREERALPSFSGPGRETTAALDVDPGNLGGAADPETRERYAREASRMADEHDPGDAI